VNTLRANSQLQKVVKNPIIPLNKKNAVIKAVFGDKIHKVTSAFLKIVVDKGRAEIIYGTAKEFLHQYNQFKNIITAKVVSATPLTVKAKEEIIGKVKAVTGGEVVLDLSVNEKLIGGFILTVGDKQFDTSILSSLTQLKKQFSQRVIG
jgi:F-type H+-transporting ATPase subunit delta